MAYDVLRTKTQGRYAPNIRVTTRAAEHATDEIYTLVQTFETLQSIGGREEEKQCVRERESTLEHESASIDIFQFSPGSGRRKVQIRNLRVGSAFSPCAVNRCCCCCQGGAATAQFQAIPPRERQGGGGGAKLGGRRERRENASKTTVRRARRPSNSAVPCLPLLRNGVHESTVGITIYRQCRLEWCSTRGGNILTEVPYLWYQKSHIFLKA